MPLSLLSWRWGEGGGRGIRWDDMLLMAPGTGNPMGISSLFTSLYGMSHMHCVRGCTLQPTVRPGWAWLGLAPLGRLCVCGVHTVQYRSASLHVMSTANGRSPPNPRPGGSGAPWPGASLGHCKNKRVVTILTFEKRSLYYTVIFLLTNLAVC